MFVCVWRYPISHFILNGCHNFWVKIWIDFLEKTYTRHTNTHSEWTDASNNKINFNKQTLYKILHGHIYTTEKQKYKNTNMQRKVYIIFVCIVCLRVCVCVWCFALFHHLVGVHSFTLCCFFFHSSSNNSKKHSTWIVHLNEMCAWVCWRVEQK